jgi:4-hydroxy-3-polyprenylbenzoate decarboxylase
MNRPIVLAMTGASGAVYGTRLLELLLASGSQVHLTVSPSGAAVIRQEMNVELSQPATPAAVLRLLQAQS